MEEIKSINLNTRFANNFGVTGYLENPVWLLPETIQNISAVKLKQFTFPLSIYNIDSRNNKIAFTENASPTVKTVWLTTKNYQGSSLALELQTKMNAAGANTYTVDYDLVTGTNVLTIDSGVDTFQFVETSSNAYYEAGLETRLNISDSTLETSSIDLSGVNQIHLVSNVGAIDCINSQYKVLSSITTEESAFDVSYFEDHGQDYANCNYKSLSEISLTLYDGQFRKLSPTKDFNMTVCFIIDA